MRADMELPVLLLALAVAALLQDLSPAPPAGCMKAGFLTGVALYAAVVKPAGVALVAALWAGALTDALGGLPLLCTSVFLFVAYGLVRAGVRVAGRLAWWQVAALLVAAGAGQAVWTRAVAGTGGAWLAWRTLGAVCWAALAGGLAGAVVFAVYGVADRVSGNLKPAEEGHGVQWTTERDG